MRLKAYVAWPDGGFGWAPAAFVAAWREVRRERPDVIYSTSAPYGGHLVAMALHRLTGIPWVADFRDEWAADDHAADRPRALDAAQQAASSARSRATPRRPWWWPTTSGSPGDGPRTTITNGVDPEDVPEAAGSPPADRFRLTYVGTVYGTIDLAPVVAALAAADRRRARSRRDELELRIVGGIWLPGFAVPDGVPLTQTRLRGPRRGDRGDAAGDGAAAVQARRRASRRRGRSSSTSPPSGRCCASRVPTTWPRSSCRSGMPVSWRIRATSGRSRTRCARSTGAGEAGELAAPRGSRERVLERFSRRELTRQLAGVLDDASASSERRARPRRGVGQLPARRRVGRRAAGARLRGPPRGPAASSAGTHPRHGPLRVADRAGSGIRCRASATAGSGRGARPGGARRSAPTSCTRTGSRGTDGWPPGRVCARS